MHPPIIEPDHPDRDHPLLAGGASFLASLGAEVRIAASGDNLVRRREPDDGEGPPFVVEAQGLRNLLHELVHVVQLGRLAQDHATPYREIPFDVARADHRRLLLEELACCVVSCAYLDGPERESVAWFEEQVGIQHEFFRLGPDRSSFLAALDRLAREHGAELDLVIERAYRLTADALRTTSLPEDRCRPRRALTFAALWGARRA